MKHVSDFIRLQMFLSEYNVLYRNETTARVETCLGREKVTKLLLCVRPSAGGFPGSTRVFTTTLLCTISNRERFRFRE